jgi:hypothetical protein
MCVEVCEALGCVNATVSTSTGSVAIGSVDELCANAVQWAAASDGNSVVSTTNGNICSPSDCDMEIPIGVLPFSVTGSSTLVEASCNMQIWVKQARISLEPGLVEVDCLSTAFADNE